VVTGATTAVLGFAALAITCGFALHGTADGLDATDEDEPQEDEQADEQADGQADGHGQRRIARALGHPDGRPADTVADLVSALGLPGRLRDVGVTRGDFDRLAARAFSDPVLVGNPRTPASPEDLVEILDMAW